MTIRVQITDRDALAAISHERLREYLIAHRWKHIDNINDRALVYQRRDRSRRLREVLCPTTREIGDYVSRIADAVTTLARVEDRSELRVYADLIGE